MHLNKYVFFLSLLGFLTTSIFFGNFYAGIGVGFFIFYLLIFILSLGKELPVIELIIILSLSQWVIGPIIDYTTLATHYKYYMHVPEDKYFSVVIPAMLALIVPLLFFQKKVYINKYTNKIKHISNTNRKVPWVLLTIGLVSDIIAPFLPSAFSFILFIFGQFKYIALIYMFFSDIKYSNTLIYGVFGLTLITSIQSGLFHDLLLWFALFLTFLAYYFKWKLGRLVLVILIGLFFGIVTQSIKSQYREIIAEKPALASVETFTSLAYDQIIGGEMFNSSESINELNVRLNQGWIISAIIYNIPKYQGYADGETVEDAISASLVPRFLNPDKKEAGGQENFRRFTGLLLKNDTSMGSSILGEAYANYGANGAVLFMFLWGIFLVSIFNLFVRIGRNHPSIILWIPLLFLQALKAETELVVVLNHIVKSGLLIFLFFWFATKTLNWKL